MRTASATQTTVRNRFERSPKPTPVWVAQISALIGNNLPAGLSRKWREQLSQELDRLDGRVPFTVFNDWHLSTVCRLAEDVAIRRGRDPSPHRDIARLHDFSLRGFQSSKEEWRQALWGAHFDTEFTGSGIVDIPNARACAFANNSAAAYCYSNADAVAFAQASTDNGSPLSYARVVAEAYSPRCHLWGYQRLADGFIESLSRTPAPSGRAS